MSIFVDCGVGRIEKGVIIDVGERDDRWNEILEDDVGRGGKVKFVVLEREWRISFRWKELFFYWSIEIGIGVKREYLIRVLKICNCRGRWWRGSWLGIGLWR